MIELVVHADDFGISEKVNNGIVEAFTRGIVTSSSIMANGAAFEHAVAICKAFPGLDVGVHLTLVEEQPVLSAGEVPSLVSEKGRFHKDFKQFSKNYILRKIDFLELEKELDAQIAKSINSGVTISHLDSHQHIHAWPGILNVTLKLAKKYKIPVVRFPQEKNHVKILNHWVSLNRCMQLFILNSICKIERNFDAIRTDHFRGFLFSGKLNKKNLLTILGDLPSSGTCELMCHPGFYDPDSKYVHWDYHWEEELGALIDPEVILFIKRKGIHLTNFKKIVQGFIFGGAVDSE